MRTNLKDIIVPIIKTIILLVLLEVITTTIFPNIGLENFRLPFNILIVLYLGLTLETPYLAILIMLVQVFHGFFSVEGWELGTVTGIVICVIVSYLRDTIHFSSWLMTILITQVFQVLWFIVQSVLLYVQLGSLNYILERAVTFFPQSVVIALLSPFFFFILNRFWNDDPKGSLGAGI